MPTDARAAESSLLGFCKAIINDCNFVPAVEAVSVVAVIYAIVEPISSKPMPTDDASPEMGDMAEINSSILPTPIPTACVITSDAHAAFCEISAFRSSSVAALLTEKP